MENSSADSSIAKNIFVGYFILILHVLLLVVLGVCIVFFRGIILYLPWIVGGGLTVLLLSGIWFYRRMKAGKRSLKDAIKDNVPQNRPVEISVLGGLASVRLGSSHGGAPMVAQPLQLEDGETSRLRSLENLMDMYNKGLISKEEFAMLKQDVLHSCGSAVKGNAAINNSTNNNDVIDVDFTSH